MLRATDSSASDTAQTLCLQGVSIRYGASLIVDRFSLDVAPGEFLTLLGPSGSGKTSLLMAIAGFVPLAAGEIRFGPISISRLPPHRRGLGVVFQSYALFPHMNVFDNVAYPLRVRRTPAPQIRERVERALALVKMDTLVARGVHELSGGQRQRVALARAIVFEPRVLLMDEPLAALDRKLREHMQVELRRLHERLGITTIYVTHDQREALTMSDRVVVMDRGRIAQVDSPRALYEWPKTRFVADFLGVSSFIPVEVTQDAVRSGQHAWSVEGARWSGPRRPGSNAVLVLRPEALCIACDVDGPMNRLPAILRSAAFEGDALFLEAEAEGGVLLRLRVSAACDVPDPGSVIVVGWHAESSVVIPEAHD